jgi:cbb3-type cytochrome oxidase subunit 1
MASSPSRSGAGCTHCCRWRRAGAAGQIGLRLHFWPALLGSFIYVISLSIGGTIQGLD